MTLAPHKLWVWPEGKQRQKEESPRNNKHPLRQQLELTISSQSAWPSWATFPSISGTKSVTSEDKILCGSTLYLPEKTVYRKKDLCRFSSSAVSGHGHVSTLWFWTCISQLLWLGQKFTWMCKCLRGRTQSSIFCFWGASILTPTVAKADSVSTGKGLFPHILVSHCCLLFPSWCPSWGVSLLDAALICIALTVKTVENYQFLYGLRGFVHVYLIFHFLYNLNINLLSYT